MLESGGLVVLTHYADDDVIHVDGFRHKVEDTVETLKKLQGTGTIMKEIGPIDKSTFILLQDATMQALLPEVNLKSQVCDGGSIKLILKGPRKQVDKTDIIIKKSFQSFSHSRLQVPHFIIMLLNDRVLQELNKILAEQKFCATVYLDVETVMAICKTTEVSSITDFVNSAFSQEHIEVDDALRPFINGEEWKVQMLILQLGGNLVIQQTSTDIIIMGFKNVVMEGKESIQALLKQKLMKTKAIPSQSEGEIREKCIEDGTRMLSIDAVKNSSETSSLTVSSARSIVCDPETFKFMRKKNPGFLAQIEMIYDVDITEDDKDRLIEITVNGKHKKAAKVRLLEEIEKYKKTLSKEASASALVPSRGGYSGGSGGYSGGSGSYSGGSDSYSGGSGGYSGGSGGYSGGVRQLFRRFRWLFRRVRWLFKRVRWLFRRVRWLFRRVRWLFKWVRWLFRRVRWLFRSVRQLFRRFRWLFRRVRWLFKRVKWLFRRVRWLFRRARQLFKRVRRLFRVIKFRAGRNKRPATKGWKDGRPHTQQCFGGSPL